MEVLGKGNNFNDMLKNYVMEVEDASCNYFFQHISKGTTWLEDSFTIDRTGTFSTAAPSLQCTYAPEFSARTAATSFKVKQ